MAIFDQDYSTLITSGSPSYNALAPKVVEANWRYRVTAGTVGRELFRLLASHTLSKKQSTVARAYAFSEHGKSGYLASLLDRAADVGVQVGTLTGDEVKEWRTEVDELQKAGKWFACLTYVGVYAKKKDDGKL